MSWTYLRVAERTVGLTPVNDLYLVRLVLSNRTITPAGTGAGSTGGFPAPPPGAATHWYPFGFTFTTDGAGSASGSSTTPFTTISSTNTTAQDFPIGDYVVHFTYSASGDITSKAATLATLGGTPVTSFTMDTPEGDSGTIDTTMTVAAPITDVYATFSASGESHAAYTVTVSGWIDPVGWETGEGPVAPAAGQWVYGETPTPDPDGSTTIFTAAWAYATGSLGVVMNGFRLTPGVDFTESDPASGEFTFTDPPPTGAEIVVNYQGR